MKLSRSTLIRYSTNVEITSIDFREIAGTVAFPAGQPTTKIKYGSSFAGRVKIAFKNFIGAGVWVRDTSPA